MARFQIFDLPLHNGRIGICQMPGRDDRLADLTAIRFWRADMVMTMTTGQELVRAGMADLGAALGTHGIDWQHLPIEDFNAPSAATGQKWTAAAASAHLILQNGGRVLAHCWGGCGRSGLALLRLMAEAGETPDQALQRLRQARPCAVETDAQKIWASQGYRKG